MGHLTTLRWIGVGEPPITAGIQSSTVDPDTQNGSEGEHEWLVTNGLGGYASGTMTGLVTRRFHGYLVAALPAPRGRTMMLNNLQEVIVGERTRVRLTEQPEPEQTGTPIAELREFRLELGLPVWIYELDDTVIEKRIVMPHQQNTVYVTYTRLSGAGKLALCVDPWIHFRAHDGGVAGSIEGVYALRAIAGRYDITDTLDVGLPPLRLKLIGVESRFAIEERRIRNVHYLVEQTRGYDASGDLYSPGTFRTALLVDTPVSMVASTEDWEVIDALAPADALACERTRRERLVHIADPMLQTSVGSELVLAADQFIIHPAGRLADAARAQATGDEERTIIAGYHWFTDWGRDTMISLDGLTLATGRHEEAGYILRTFAKYIKDGLIPNVFPEGKAVGLYNAADATLWFFHATKRYVDASGDRHTLVRMFSLFDKIIEAHVRGTKFGIVVDSADGLLVEGAPSLPLTWMDAKVGDLVVTPRRGKAVEINALWYNALRLMEEWADDDRHNPTLARKYGAMAERARVSFNARFWNDATQALFDVVDSDHGNDASIRPNQLFAISLPHPVLDPARWKSVVDVVRDKLLTPYGLRTLLGGQHRLQSREYFGDLRARATSPITRGRWPWLHGRVRRRVRGG